MDSLVLTEIKNGLAIMTLNRPDALNAINLPMARALQESLTRISTDDTVRALLVRGAGRHFCAGGDVKWFASLGEELSSGLDEILAILNPFLTQLLNLKVPVVTAVQGHTAGAGVGLALAGDIVLAGESFKLLSSYAAIGLSPDMGAAYALMRRVGPARAKKFFFCNAPLNATQCHGWGIVDTIHSDDALLQEAQQFALELSQAPTYALKLTKELIQGGLDRGIEEQLALEREFMARCGRSSDGLEGVKAFLEKRKPHFTGR